MVRRLLLGPGKHVRLAVVRRLRRVRRASAVLAVLAVPAALLLGAGAGPATADPDGTLPRAVPSKDTPHINDGAVYAITKVGGTIVVGGTFTSVTDKDASTSVQRNRLLAFDASTGHLLAGFDPDLDGAVRALLPGPYSHTVYVGGTFHHVGTHAVHALALLDTQTGAFVPGFDAPGLNGRVDALARSGFRLYVGGHFTKVGGVRHGRLASLNAMTGALDPYLGVDLAGHHNWTGEDDQAKAAVGVVDMALRPDGSQLVVIGNFTTADGLARDQVVRIDLDTVSAEVDPGWKTDAYTPACSWRAFDTYVRGVAYAPDGSFFAIAATGGRHGTSTLCDAVARFDSADTGSDVQPAWVDWSGGDTFYSVEITDTAVFVGGHHRWLNNPYPDPPGDAAGPGAVPRPGIAALDPRSGIPLSWNPGRHPRGVGARALLATDDGLYVGQNTNWFGHHKYNRGKIGYFPYAGGLAVPPEQTGSLPGEVYVDKPDGDLVRRTFTGTAVTSETPVTGTGTDWGEVRGAIDVSGTVFFGYDDGPLSGYTGGGDLFSLHLNGTTFGPKSVVDPYNDPYWSQFRTGSGSSGQTYRGARPSLYPSFRSSARHRVTGMFYSDGRLFYTQAGRSGLYYRGFSPQSGVLGEFETQVPTPGITTWGVSQGMFLSGDELYFAGASGNLRRVRFTGSGTTGPDPIVSGPAVDGVDWSNRAMFLAVSTANEAPDASFTKSCAELGCSFDASGSSDPDGKLVSYDWQFGDGTTGSGESPQHAYPAPGTYTVTLQVTDDRGTIDTVQHDLTVRAGGQVGFVGVSHVNGNGRTPSVSPPDGTRPGDGLVLFVTCSCSDAPALTGDLTGWTRLGTEDVSGLATTAYAKAAGSGDDTRSVGVTFDRHTKADLALLAYEGTAATPVTTADAAHSGRTTEHTTPALSGVAGRWALSYWADKSADTTRWTSVPGGVAERARAVGSGKGHIDALVADSGGPVSGGYGGLTASTDVAAKDVTWTLTLAPAAGG